MRSVLAALCLLSTTAHAVPAQFTHQGRLLDADGVPLEGEATITFRVITEETGGVIVWEEPITVLLNGGFYSAVLGTDEAENPLDTDVLSQAPVWLELQLDGEPAMFPRSAINAVPYATMATVAEEVAGGPVDASQIAVDGTPVVNELGEWVGPAPTINWSDIEGMPADFADGVDDDTDTDTDSFAALGTSCLDGDIAVWDGVAMDWVCDLDRDTLADLACTDGQLIAWSDESTGFVCANDADTVLTEAEVDAMVADNGYAMASEVFSTSFLDLTDVPDGLLDGDDDTQLTEEQVDAMVADNGYALSSDLFSKSFLELTDIPDGLSDGDDDTQLTNDEVLAIVADDIETRLGDVHTLDSLGCSAGQIAVQTSTGWECSTFEDQLDKDGDGALVWADCDDTDSALTSKATDADCDGVLTANDCDDSDAEVVAEIAEDDPDCDGLTYDIVHTGATSTGGDGYRWDERLSIDSRAPVETMGACADFCAANERCTGFMWKFDGAHSDGHSAFGYLACSLYEELVTSPTGVEHIWSARME